MLAWGGDGEGGVGKLVFGFAALEANGSSIIGIDVLFGGVEGVEPDAGLLHRVMDLQANHPYGFFQMQLNWTSRSKRLIQVNSIAFQVKPELGLSSGLIFSKIFGAEPD